MTVTKEICSTPYIYDTLLTTYFLVSKQMRAHQRICWNDKCVILTTWNAHCARHKIMGRLLLIPFFAQFSIHLLIFGRNYAKFEVASATFIYDSWTISYKSWRNSQSNCSKWQDSLFSRETQYSLYEIKTTITIFVNLKTHR